MNSNMVKPDKFDHLHLVYHFTVSFKRIKDRNCIFDQSENLTLKITKKARLKSDFFTIQSYKQSKNIFKPSEHKV